MHNYFLTPHIEYLELPVTEDEKQIAMILEKMQKAFATKDTHLLMLLLTEDAELSTYSHNENLLSKEEYLKEISKIMLRVRQITYKEVFIRTEVPRASVSCLLYTQWKGEIPWKVTRRVYQFIKKNRQWYIHQAQYIKI